MVSSTIGFVGLGNLGLPMAANLMDRSFDVLAYDVDPTRIVLAVEHGVRKASDLGSLATAGTVVLAVPDGRAVSEVLLHQGLLNRLAPGSVVVAHSTLLPSAARQIARECASRTVAFLDAPVSGGAGRARTGELTVTVGASTADLESGRPVLEASASHIVHVGEAGTGAAVKLATQLMLFSSLAGAYEALSFAAAHGVSEDVVLGAVNTGLGASWVSHNWGFYDRLSADYDAASVPADQRPWSKDLAEIARAAAELKLAAPLTALLVQTLPVAVRSHAASMSDLAPQDGR